MLRNPNLVEAGKRTRFRPHNCANPNGRPKDFSGARELARRIALEPDEDKLTCIERIFREWAKSENPQVQRAFIEYAFGKVPETIDLNVVRAQAVEFIMPLLIKHLPQDALAGLRADIRSQLLASAN